MDERQHDSPNEPSSELAGGWEADISDFYPEFDEHGSESNYTSNGVASPARSRKSRKWSGRSKVSWSENGKSAQNASRTATRLSSYNRNDFSYKAEYIGSVSGDNEGSQKQLSLDEVDGAVTENPGEMQPCDGTDSDYDTDLEMDPHRYIYPEKYEVDTTGKLKYIRACQDIGVQPIKSFLRNMQQDNLSLRHHGIGPNGMKALATPLESNTSIETIELEGNWVMAEGAGHLCRVLKENVFVSRLNLAENQLYTDGAIAVCKLLLSNKHIEHVNLAGNGIGNGVIDSLFEVLTQPGGTLKHLDLSHNRLDDTSAQKVKDALVDNECLHWLDISWNHFQAKGCILIADGLKENVGLRELGISMNGFGSDGGKALGRALQANRTLGRLGANFCRLSLDCMREIALGLMNNDVLQILELAYNCMEADGAFLLLTGIQQNESSKLMFLDLGNTRVSHKFKEIQDKLSEERGLAIRHGGVNEDYKSTVFEIDPMEAFRRNPMSKLKEWLSNAGYRLIDLLRHFDKDQSWSLSIDEFKRGIESTGIPLTEEQIHILVKDLDKDGDGEIDFSELIEGDKEHKKTKRELLKYITQKEEEMKEREQQEARRMSLTGGPSMPEGRRMSLAGGSLMPEGRRMSLMPEFNIVKN